MAVPSVPSVSNPAVSALDEVQALPWVGSRIEHETVIPATLGRFVAWPERLHPQLITALGRIGLERGYSHQAEAIEAALDGRDVTVVTPTASGKSLCYVLPVLDGWLRDRQARSLWLFPTKALAQDQVAALADITRYLPEGFMAAAYDGDTPTGTRRAIRADGHVVITNPDMLHSGVLPNHTAWIRLLQNLRYIVIDELHSYRGLFGSHLANVLRRLFRLCRFYGSNPVVIGCSATIANPGELAERLLERPVRCITDNGAPRSERRLWLWNPPLVPGGSGARRSAMGEARQLVGELLRKDLQTIAFMRSRSSVEVLLSYLQRLHPPAVGASARAGDKGPVRGYRSGYLPKERRAIEAGLRDGTVRGVVSTNALELGIDVGHLDAAVLVGFPGSIASLWQQFGRAGRRGDAALGVFIATDSPLDQFLIRHPEYLLTQAPEQALINPDNLLVLGAHLQASAFELAFDEQEGFGAADGVEELLQCFAEDGLVHRSGRRYHWSSDAFPAEAIHLRRASATNVVIIDTSSSVHGPGQGPQGAWSGSGGGRPGTAARVIGEVDQFSAPVLVHDDALYLHEGAQFHVERLDWEEKRAYVHPVSVDYYTLAETRVQVAILDRYRRQQDASAVRSLGEVRLSRLATMYKKVRFFTNENIGAGPINLPEQNLHTVAYWLSFDPDRLTAVSPARLAGALSAVGTAMHTAACLLCMSDPRDIGRHIEVRMQAAPVTGVGVPEAAWARAAVPHVDEFVQGARPTAREADELGDIGWPAIYLYDCVPGGVGLAERCHERSAELVGATRELIRSCRCETGCPSCIGPVSIGSDVKRHAVELLALA